VKPKDTHADVEPAHLNAKTRKRLKQREKTRANRRQSYIPKKRKLREEGWDAAGLPEGPMTENVAVVKMKRRPDLATAMLGKQWDHGDPIFQDFKRCGGKGSGTIIYLDADTSELVLIVKITESKDLTDVDRTVFNSIFSEFAKGMKYHPAEIHNDAVVKGKMRVLNWSETAVRKGRTFLEIHKLFAESF
jgi:hypothetical protein